MPRITELRSQDLPPFEVRDGKRTLTLEILARHTDPSTPGNDVVWLCDFGEAFHLWQILGQKVAGIGVISEEKAKRYENALRRVRDQLHENSAVHAHTKKLMLADGIASELLTLIDDALG